MNAPLPLRFAVPVAVNRLESVQMLRGLAAMLVVVHHAGLMLVTAPVLDAGGSLLIPSAGVAHLGAIGVDLFFVISGFVMALSARRFVGPAGAGVFLMQRYIRIAPLFYLVSLLMLAEALRAKLPVDPVSVLNTITFIPVFDDATYSWPLHYLGWTLAFEFVFYLMVAALIAAGHGGQHPMLLVVLIALPLVGLVIEAQPILWKILTNALLWEFALGVLACILWEKRLLARFRILFAAVLALALVAGALSAWLSPESLRALNFQPVAGTTTFARTLYWGLPAFLFFCLVIGFRALPEGNFSRLLKLLGDASYSIYLSHLFVVMFLRIVIKEVPLQPDLTVLLTLVLSAVVGIGVYRLAEQPMLALGQRSIKGWSLRHMRASG